MNVIIKSSKTILKNRKNNKMIMNINKLIIVCFNKNINQNCNLKTYQPKASKIKYKVIKCASLAERNKLCKFHQIRKSKISIYNLKRKTDLYNIKNKQN
jgi:hypothetical protein